jgi:hypothetical protein
LTNPDGHSKLRSLVRDESGFLKASLAIVQPVGYIPHPAGSTRLWGVLFSEHPRDDGQRFNFNEERIKWTMTFKR